RPAKCGFHFASYFHRRIVRVIGDVAPFERATFRNIALEPDVVREPKRQQFVTKRNLGEGLLAPDAETTLAVEQLACFQAALGGSHDVGAEIDRRSRWLVAQRGARDRNTKLEADHVNWPV